MGVPHETKGLRPMSDLSLEPSFVIRCISSFDKQDKEDDTLEDVALTSEESQEADKRQEADLPQQIPDPISDEEEDEPLCFWDEPSVELQVRP
ncbi:hypothetical protein N7537_005243 [Penicillium hordei]|uniref:Uncharacterized protein n=1 Tax=Penicillium hordei TaxID=40994 RepID=A0AAD6H4L6_9EURO|nr:uncharacterized protein N7537_005243 [Penicillium hordei]KAJ5608624.1 hypothetical protein N7537_005243 [Penicillium hordei]